MPRACVWGISRSLLTGSTWYIAAGLAVLPGCTAISGSLWKRAAAPTLSQSFRLPPPSTLTEHPEVHCLPAAYFIWGVSCWFELQRHMNHTPYEAEDALAARGAGRWSRFAIWLRGSLLGCEYKTHYPQWTKATEGWFPLRKPLIPQVRVGEGERKCEKEEPLVPGRMISSQPASRRKVISIV